MSRPYLRSVSDDVALMVVETFNEFVPTQSKDVLWCSCTVNNTEPCITTVLKATLCFAVDNVIS